MPSLYVFYVTADDRLVSVSDVYDRMLLEEGRVAWVRSERAVNGATTIEQATQDADPKPGEQVLGVVAL